MSAHSVAAVKAGDGLPEFAGQGLAAVMVCGPGEGPWFKPTG